MSFTELVIARRSVRSYKKAPLKRADIEKCVEAARYAPSACNSQPWKFIIVDDPNILDIIAGSAFGSPMGMNKFVKESSAIVMILSRREKLTAWMGSKLRRTSFRRIDIGLATGHFVLKAQELGIGSCILGWFKERKIKRLLQVPRKEKIELAISMGIPEERDIKEKKLKSIEKTLSVNRY